jgi:hypothetical protein
MENSSGVRHLFYLIPGRKFMEIAAETVLEFS